MSIITKSYPRAALIGNPSDGYNGKTIAFIFSNFSVDVELTESENLNLIPGTRDTLEYENIKDLHGDILSYGYYGGVRLLKATIKKFFDYIQENNIELPSRNFTLRYSSDIPKRLGLAGSSAIITAALKAISQFYEVNIPKPIFANLVLSAEADELSIGAGLQDRVAQAYESPVFMDFNKELMDTRGYGDYKIFKKILLKNIYIAFRRDLSEGSEVVHNDLRERYDQGDQEVHQAMKRFAELTTGALDCLQNGEAHRLGDLMNENFDLRKSIIPISRSNLEMIDLARSVGASSKFTGSGGAIIGTYSNDKMFEDLQNIMSAKGIEVIEPDIVDNA